VQFAVSLFDFLTSLLTAFEGEAHCLEEFELNVLLPLLCSQSGNNNAVLKDKVKKLIKQTALVSDKQLIFKGLMNFGVTQKNLKSQAECLDELAYFIKVYGVDYS
jgi:hypothetical protein